MNVIEKTQLWTARREFWSMRADFYYDMAITMEDRVPLFTTLRKLELRAKNRAPHQAVMYRQMIRSLESGSFAMALQGCVPTNELVLIDSLQGAGDANMAEGLKFLSSTAEKIDAMTTTARKALVYPLSLLVLFGALLTGFALGVVPTLTSVLPPDKWPFLGKILYEVSLIIGNHGFKIVMVFVSILVLFMYSLPRWASPVRRRLDKFFPYSFYRDFSGAMLIVSLASMMRSGVSLRSALESNLKFCNAWTRWHIQRILLRLSSANTSNFGDAFQTGMLNQYLEDRVQDAAERRNPIEAFVKIGVNSIDRVILNIEASAKRVNGIMMLVCGLILMFMMMAFFGTALEIQNGIRDSSRNSSQVR